MEPITAIFDETCHEWKNNLEWNRLYLQMQEKFMNYRLRRDGFLFLNDVFEHLGIRRTSQGQRVGWLYGEDNYIDFGMEEKKDTVVLHFNVDGDILDKIDELPSST